MSNIDRDLPDYSFSLEALNKDTEYKYRDIELPDPNDESHLLVAKFLELFPIEEESIF